MGLYFFLQQKKQQLCSPRLRLPFQSLLPVLPVRSAFLIAATGWKLQVPGSIIPSWCWQTVFFSRQELAQIRTCVACTPLELCLEAHAHAVILVAPGLLSDRPLARISTETRVTASHIPHLHQHHLYRHHCIISHLLPKSPSQKPIRADHKQHRQHVGHRGRLSPAGL